MSSFPQQPPPPPPSSSAAPSSTTPSQSTSRWAYTCPKCHRQGSARCTRHMCASCCRDSPIDSNGDPCKVKGHNYTTPPMADVSPESVATLPGQPRRTSYAHNVSSTFEQLFQRDQIVHALAATHDRTSAIVTKEVTNSIFLEVWPTVRTLATSLRSVFSLVRSGRSPSTTLHRSISTLAVLQTLQGPPNQGPRLRSKWIL